MNNAKTSVAGGNENHHPNNASRSPPFVLPPQLHGIHLSAGQLALWDEETMKNHGREVIDSTMTNQNDDSLLLSLNERVVAETMDRLRALLFGSGYKQEYGGFTPRLGAPQTLVKAMNQHPGSDKIQEHGCFILASFLYYDSMIDLDFSGDVCIICEKSTWDKPMVAAGCVEAVIAAMKSHPYKVDVQCGGCKFFHALAGKSRPNTNDVNDDYRKRIIQAKGLVAVGEARRIHHDNPAVVRVSEKANFAILTLQE